MKNPAISDASSKAQNQSAKVSPKSESSFKSREAVKRHRIESVTSRQRRHSFTGFAVKTIRPIAPPCPAET